MSDVATRKSQDNRALNKACQVLTGIVTGIVADGHLHNMEIQMLSTWLGSNESVTHTWPGCAISRLLKEVLADGQITEEERQHLLAELQALVGNDFSDSGSADSELAKLPFDLDPVMSQGMRLCFTGEFVYGTRNACERLALKHGLEPIKGVSKKINALVVGTHISPEWVNTSYGLKIMRVMELREEGHPILIVREQHWIEKLLAERID